MAKVQIEKERKKSLFYRSWFNESIKNQNQDKDIIRFHWGLAFSRADMDEVIRCFYWSNNVKSKLNEAKWEGNNKRYWQQRAPTMIGYCLELLMGCLISDSDSQNWSESFGYESLMKYRKKRKVV